jgi:hypothetical protein
VPTTETEIFSRWGVLKKADAWGFFGVLLLLLLLLVGLYVAAAAVSAARYGLGMAAIWSDIANVHTTSYLT